MVDHAPFWISFSVDDEIFEVYKAQIIHGDAHFFTQFTQTQSGKVREGREAFGKGLDVFWRFRPGLRFLYAAGDHIHTSMIIGYVYAAPHGITGLGSTTGGDLHSGHGGDISFFPIIEQGGFHIGIVGPLGVEPQQIIILFVSQEEILDPGVHGFFIDITIFIVDGEDGKIHPVPDFTFCPDEIEKSVHRTGRRGCAAGIIGSGRLGVIATGSRAGIIGSGALAAATGGRRARRSRFSPVGKEDAASHQHHQQCGNAGDEPLGPVALGRGSRCSLRSSRLLPQQGGLAFFFRPGVPAGLQLFQIKALQLVQAFAAGMAVFFSLPVPGPAGALPQTGLFPGKIWQLAPYWIWYSLQSP